jgi:hypothetical protein
MAQGYLALGEGADGCENKYRINRRVILQNTFSGDRNGLFLYVFGLSGGSYSTRETTVHISLQAGCGVARRSVVRVTALS